MPSPSKSERARVVDDGRGHVHFTCPLCRIVEPAADKAAAQRAKTTHVATAAHRSALRAARRE